MALCSVTTPSVLNSECTLFWHAMEILCARGGPLAVYYRMDAVELAATPSVCFLISFSKKRLKKKRVDLYCADILSLENKLIKKLKSEYVLSSGLFSVKHTIASDEWWVFIQKMIINTPAQWQLLRVIGHSNN